MAFDIHACLSPPSVVIKESLTIQKMSWFTLNYLSLLASSFLLVVLIGMIRCSLNRFKLIAKCFLTEIK